VFILKDGSDEKVRVNVGDTYYSCKNIVNICVTVKLRSIHVLRTICTKICIIIIIIIIRPASSCKSCQYLISPEWVTSPQQGTSSSRIAAFSLWRGMFLDGISTVPDGTVIPL
jgi:hypothetical protein